MSTARFGAVIGTAIGAVWVFGGFLSALLVSVLAAVGFLVGLMVEGRVDMTEYLGHRHNH